MKMNTNGLKRIVSGTPIEKPIRSFIQAARSMVKTLKKTIIPKDINCRYDEETFAVMQRVLCTTSNCIDVGAHSGDMLRELVRIAPKGVHYAFEPLPELFAGLQSQYADLKNVKLFNVVLSDQSGVTKFQHVLSNPAYSGIRKRTYPRDIEKVEEIEVHQVTLDELIDDDIQIDFIKVDVEGAEMFVFRGARRTIRRCQPIIVFEHGVGAADHYDTQPGDVFDLLCGECSLQIHVMYDWLKHDASTPLTRDQFTDQFFSCRNYYFVAVSGTKRTSSARLSAN
jgi:FkbM family methyltransferase